MPKICRFFSEAERWWRYLGWGWQGLIVFCLAAFISYLLLILIRYVAVRFRQTLWINYLLRTLGFLARWYFQIGYRPRVRRTLDDEKAIVAPFGTWLGDIYRPLIGFTVILSRLHSDRHFDDKIRNFGAAIGLKITATGRLPETDALVFYIGGPGFGASAYQRSYEPGLLNAISPQGSVKIPILGRTPGITISASSGGGKSTMLNKLVTQLNAARVVFCGPVIESGWRDSAAEIIDTSLVPVASALVMLQEMAVGLEQQWRSGDQPNRLRAIWILDEASNQVLQDKDFRLFIENTIQTCRKFGLLIVMTSTSGRVGTTVIDSCARITGALSSRPVFKTLTGGVDQAPPAPFTFYCQDFHGIEDQWLSFP